MRECVSERLVLERKVQKRTGEEEVEELDLKDCRIQEEGSEGSGDTTASVGLFTCRS